MASDLHHSPASRLMLLVGGFVAALGFGGAAILTQMSGCCGGAPTHGCKFIEVPDAAHHDSSADGPQTCGQYQTCVPGETTCCFEPQSEPILRCIPLGGVCMGPMGNCGGDDDCASMGSGLHCCGSVATATVQCQADCTGDYTNDQSLRICKVDGECPPARPKCGSINFNHMAYYVCIPATGA